MLVRETISFQRYKDPKSALGLRPILYYFNIGEEKKYTIFSEKSEIAIDSNDLYTFYFSLEQGNIYCKRDSWQQKEIRARGFVNDLEGAETFILNKYLKLRKKGGL